jgi:hypothetical protein
MVCVSRNLRIVHALEHFEAASTFLAFVIVVGHGLGQASLAPFPERASVRISCVGDGAKPDFLPEQQRTNHGVKWPGIGGHVRFGECGRKDSRHRCG